MIRLRLLRIAFVLVLALPASAARGNIAALDNASNPAYSWEADGAWKGLGSTEGENPPGMDNGGFGFLPWDFSGGYHQPEFSPYGNLNHFIDGIDFPTSSYNDLGSLAFGLTNANLAFGGHTARATRSFASPLSAGEALVLNFDNPLLVPLNLWAPAGFLLRLNTGQGPVLDGDPNSATERFGVATTSGFLDGRWFATDSAGFTDTGVEPSATNSGTQFRFTLETDETYSAEFLRLSDGQSLFSLSGRLKAAGAGAIDSIEITIFGNGSGDGIMGGGGSPTGEREFYFSELHIDRPPSSVISIGDYNLNGIVDAPDYTVWRDLFGKVVTPGVSADGSGNGEIDTEDYDVWKTAFGTESAVAGLFSVSVPEPRTVLLGLVALLCAWVVRARH